MGDFIKSLAKINCNELIKINNFLKKWARFLTTAKNNLERASAGIDIDPKESEEMFISTIVNIKDELLYFSNVQEKF